MNNIYVVRNEYFSCDEYDALCLVAKNEQQARELAITGDLIDAYNAARLSCEAYQCSVVLVGTTDKAAGTLILASYIAG